jgi:glutamate N-acetyltransferase/amino-acid N-acetyltransferase
MAIKFSEIFGIKSQRDNGSQDLPVIEGMELSSASAGLYKKQRDDVCFFYFKEGATFAGVYTKSSTKSHCIMWNKSITSKKIKALFVNTKNANTLNGQQGYTSIKELAYLISRNKNISVKDILFASTGVIGEKFPLLKVKYSIDKLMSKTMKPNKFEWIAAANAIMTTDTIAKMTSESFQVNNKKINIAGIAKGSGMVFPNMGTMFGFIFTDANISPSILNYFLKKNIEETFNAISVDGDTSTNDMVLLFSTNKSKNKLITNKNSPAAKIFEQKLKIVMLDLAKKIVADGEGAQKFISINIANCKNKNLAKSIGFSIANSPLVKTAIAAEDPNWGRIMMAIGKTSPDIKIEKVLLKIGETLIFRNGEIVKNYKESDVKEYMKKSEILISVDMRSGKNNFSVYTCDFTKEYISINADYRT